jgi:hypothetical protein
MKLPRQLPRHLFVAVTLAVSLCAAGACDNQPVQPGAAGGAGSNGQGAAGTSGGAGTTGGGGSSGTTGAAGSTAGTTGGAGNGAGGTTGAAGSSPTGVAGTTGAAGSTAGTTGAGGSVVSTGAAGTTGAAGAGDPPAPRPIMVVPGTKVFQSNIAGGPVRFDHSKPVMGKLILLLGGICGGTGAGGIESFINGYGFHTYAPPTQTCVNTAPQKYKDIIAKTPMDPEANRQVGDARMELWDGVDRVDWVTVNKGDSILDHTIAAIRGAMTQDPDGDWGYFLNADGTLRTSDVWVVGYSWGSQTWGMISSYVRFGRVICTSGPQAEGFPNGTWITHPSATPNDRKFTLLGFNQPYPSTDKVDTAPNTVTSMIETTTQAGWVGPPINVKPGDTGPFTGGHQIAMVGSNNHSPGGHTVFCTGDSMNGWAALCKYVFNVAQ